MSVSHFSLAGLHMKRIRIGIRITLASRVSESDESFFLLLSTIYPDNVISFPLGFEVKFDL